MKIGLVCWLVFAGVIVAQAVGWLPEIYAESDQLCQSTTQTRFYDVDGVLLAGYTEEPPDIGEVVLLRDADDEVKRYLVDEVTWMTPMNLHNCGIVSVRVDLVER
jgi:hypothetical protein